MNDLQSIASGKARADLQRRIDDLPKLIKAIQHELIAQGVGIRSGPMLKRVTSACTESIHGYGSTLAREYKWAIDQSLGVSESWVNSLIVEANDSFNPLLDASIAHIKKAVLIAASSGSGPNFNEILISELKAAHFSVQNDVRLALKAAFAEKRRGLIRKISGWIPGLSKLLKGG